MATEFASLDIFTKDYLKSATTSDTNTAISQCIARYDRVLEVRGTTDFANFMGRGVSSSSNRTAAINDSATIVMYVLFVTTFVGFAAIAVLKKKKFSK